jgi:hypothetical protein
VATKINKITFGKSKAGNDTMKFELVAEDEDVRGRRTFKTIPYSGTNKSGKPNVHQLLDVAASAGITTEKIKALNGTSMTTEQFAQELQGRVCYTRVRAEEYEGRWSTSAVGFISQKGYEDSKAIGSHRVPLTGGAKAALDGTNNGASGGGAVTTSAVATTAAAAKATSLL